MILKPHQMKRKPVAVKIIGTREVCCDNAAGRAEYVRRRRLAWERDHGECGWCLRPVMWEEATTDHLIPRGAGGANRCDKVSSIRATHCLCNGERASSRLLTRAEWIAAKRAGRAA